MSFITKIIQPLLPLLTATAVFAYETHVRPSEAGLGYAATSVNTAVFRSSSVATHDSTQYVAYYDPEGYVSISKRRLGTDHWETTRTQYKGNVSDAHNVISLGIDGQGYLHISFDHHGHPLHYAKSIAPGATAFGELEQMTGRDEKDVTYPEFHNLPDGRLLFVYRSGYSGGGNMVMNIYDPDTGKWERLHDVLIDGEGDRNAYWQLCVDPQGVIHVSWVWRETWMVETNHDLCYACSADGGKTWHRSDGSLYELPIRLETAEKAWSIPQNSELINQTSMTTNAEGRPVIATYWRNENDSIPQYRLVSLGSDGQWNMEEVGHRTSSFSLSGGGTKMIPIARPKVAINKDMTYFIFRDEERGSRVSLAWRKAEGKWQISDLSDFPVDAWEPSFDTKLWNEEGRLHIFVQRAGQGDGEKVTSMPPQPIYIFEIE